MAEITILIRDVEAEIEFEIDAREAISKSGELTNAEQIALEMLEYAMTKLSPAGPKPHDPTAN